MSEVWKFEVQRNPEGARFEWCVDIYRGDYHYREIEHHTRADAVERASKVMGDFYRHYEKDVIITEDYPIPYLPSRPTFDQFRGLILGMAVGDAVGAPVEKAPLAESRRYLEDRVIPKNFEGDIRSTFEDLPFGHYTDDTQMARELMLSIVDSGGHFDPENYAARIARLFREGIIVGSGGTTRRAVQRLIEGVPWSQAGEGSSAGNGAAMRVAPIGLIRDFGEMVTATFEQARITHTHPESVAASVMIAHMVHRAAYVPDYMSPLNMVLDTADYLDPAIVGIPEEYAKACAYLSKQMRDLWNLVQTDWDKNKMMEWVVAHQDETNWEGISPYAISSSLWAVYSFVTSPDNYWKTIETALWPGGDVDTTAAMAGAMSGVRNGVEGIPDVVLSKLNDGGQWKAPHLMGLADDLCFHITGRGPLRAKTGLGVGAFNPSGLTRLVLKKPG